MIQKRKIRNFQKMLNIFNLKLSHIIVIGKTDIVQIS